MLSVITVTWIQVDEAPEFERISRLDGDNTVRVGGVGNCGTESGGGGRCGGYIGRGDGGSGRLEVYLKDRLKTASLAASLEASRHVWEINHKHHKLSLISVEI